MEKKLETAIAVLVLSLAIVVASCDGNGTEPDVDCIDVGGGADAGGDCLPVDGDADGDADNESDEDCLILVATEPSGAVVFVDGESTDAVTPTTLPLPQGQEVVLSFALNDYDESPATLIVDRDCTPPVPFVLYPSVELENGTLWRNNSVTGTEGEYPVAFLLQEGPELEGEIRGAPVFGSISPEGGITLVDEGVSLTTTLVGHRMNPSLLEGMWSNSGRDAGEWRLTW